MDACGVHIILVGDSLCNVVQGKSSTLPVTLDEMIYHTEMVARAASSAMLVGDMPFMAYQESTEQAVADAGRFLKETGASAFKLEGALRSAT